MEPTLAALEPASRAVLLALLNALWQGTALAASAALLLRLLPRSNAATRHLVWGAALGVVAALPLLPLLAVAPGSAAAAGPGPVPAGEALPGWSLPAPSGAWPTVVLAALAAVAGLRLALVARELRGVRRLKREAVPLPSERAEGLRELLGDLPLRGVRVGVSGRAGSPLTVGFRRPMILFPERLLPELGEEELRQVTLHELAHLRRRDDWVNLAQRLVEAALFFHPAVRWIGARMELEREMACDDEVVAAMAEGRSYARCLARLAELAVSARRASLAPGLAPGRSQLARRVGALLAPDRPARPGVSASTAAASLALLLGGAVGLRGSLPAIAFAEGLASPVATLAAVRAEPVALPPAREAAAVASIAREEPAPASPAPVPPAALPAPEARVVAVASAPEIVEEARVVSRPPRATRVARGPVPPPEGRDRGPALRFTFSVPFAGGTGGSRPAPGLSDRYLPGDEWGVRRKRWW